MDILSQVQVERVQDRYNLLRQTGINTYILGRESLGVLNNVVHFGVVVPNDLLKTAGRFTLAVVHCRIELDLFPYPVGATSLFKGNRCKAE